MKYLFCLCLLLFLSSNTLFAQTGPSTSPAAKNIQPSQSNLAPLTNQDLIELLQAKLTADEMIAKIKASPDGFDTSAAALHALKDAGVPQIVIDAVLEVEKSTRIGRDGNVEQTRLEQVVVPAGTQLDVEARYTVSSLDVHAGDLISFRVLVPIKVDGAIVIDKGALVTARVVESKRGGHWGKAGRLSWTMQDVL